MNEFQDKGDALPPHDMLAEKGVLGSVLRDESVLPQIVERFRGQVPFYDLRHATIFGTMVNMHTEGVAIDVITLSARLKASGNLDAVGGGAYLSSLPDEVPSAHNWPFYCNVVVDRFLARKGIQLSTQWRNRFIATEGLNESTLAEMTREIEVLKVASESHLGANPQNLKMPVEFEEDYLKAWFRKDKGEPGIPLPFPFPMNLRAHEFTLMTGDNGSGKSSMLGQICIEAGMHGCEVTIASMEVPPAVTLWIMARQLLGTGRLNDDEEGRARAIAALGWLQGHVRIYNFLGITDWRHLMDTFRFVEKQPSIVTKPPLKDGMPRKLFVVDSVMRIGIQDDDYALQGLVATEMANFAVKSGVHMVAVIHENKGEGSMKERVRGSKQWTDNAHNVTGMRKNDKKGMKLANLEESLRTEEITQEEFDKERGALRKVWDSQFLLSKQRYPGSRQNGSKHLWFDFEALQFHDKPGLTPINYLM